jgi:hypothetical protein
MINLYTDGSCSGNPGPGGWGYVLEYGETRKVGGDGATHTTNNRMELYAVICGLHAIRDKTHPVTVHSDSEYVVKGMNTWRHDWKARAGRTLVSRMCPTVTCGNTWIIRSVSSPVSPSSTSRLTSVTPGTSLPTRSPVRGQKSPNS